MDKTLGNLTIDLENTVYQMITRYGKQNHDFQMWHLRTYLNKPAHETITLMEWLEMIDVIAPYAMFDYRMMGYKVYEV